MECLADCPDVDPSKAAVNVGGFHAVKATKAGDPDVCTADVAASTDPKKNNDCMPVTAGSSVNATTQMCQTACGTPLKGSHMFAGSGACVADTAKANAACTTAVDG